MSDKKPNIKREIPKEVPVQVRIKNSKLPNFEHTPTRPIKPKGDK